MCLSHGGARTTSPRSKSSRLQTNQPRQKWPIISRSSKPASNQMPLHIMGKIRRLQTLKTTNFPVKESCAAYGRGKTWAAPCLLTLDSFIKDDPSRDKTLC